MIKFSNVSYRYEGQDLSARNALTDIDLTVEEGDFVAILGANGSGKSTLARQINGLLRPTEGLVEVDGLDTSDPAQVWKVREAVGMVFQNPDNQIIATIVEEDVAFGPENLGLPREEICSRVSEALAAVRMEGFARSEPHLLSGGQKQRVAIAGALAMRPKYLVLDEPTSMLDPVGRREVNETLRRLNGDGVTVVFITHSSEEAIAARRVIAMEDGRIALDEPVSEAFRDFVRLEAMGIDPPVATRLASELVSAGILRDRVYLTAEDLVEAVLKSRD